MNPSRILAITLITSILLLAALVLPGIQRESAMIERTGIAMGTTIQIKVPQARGMSRGSIEAVIGKAFDEIARVEGVFSVYKDTSEISRINRLKKGEELAVSAETFDLVEKAVAGSSRSNGAFDITVKPLVDLWRQAKESGSLPPVEAVLRAKARVGWQDIVLDKARHVISFRKDGMALDMGGIAKGYATDRAIAVLKSGGIANAVVRSGGDVYCLGARSTKGPWKVGIRHPRDKERLFMELELQDKAIDTSGDYEKYFVLDNRRYSHIIDPRTGYPVGDTVVSATVIADSATSADMLATAICVLGHDGLKLADVSGAMAIMVVSQGDTYKTEMAGNVKGVFRVNRPQGL